MYLYIQSIYLDILCVFMKKKVCVHTHSGRERKWTTVQNVSNFI